MRLRRWLLAGACIAAALLFTAAWTEVAQCGPQPPPPDKPPPGCLYWSDSYDFQWTYGNAGYHKWGTGGECKPEMSIGVYICGTESNQYGGTWSAPAAKWGIHQTTRRELPAEIECVPLVADIVATFGGDGGYGWTVSIVDAGGDSSLSGTNMNPPNPIKTGRITRCVPLAEGRPGMAEYHLTSTISVIAGCDGDGWNCGTADGIVDPWMYVDPEWEYAEDFEVVGETYEGSGVWLPIHRDWMNVFVDVSTPAMAVNEGNPYVTWVDYDNDGDLDLHVVSYGASPDRLYENDGNGGFADAATGPLADTGFGLSAAWGDYDNDEDLDVYICKVQGESNSLLRNDGDGVFTDVTSGVLGDTAWNWYAAWGDYDLDGDLDLLVTGAWPMPNKLLRNEGGGSFTNVTPSLVADGGSKHCSAAWGDYDSDRYPDLCLTAYENDSGSEPDTNKLFHNNGDGSFSAVAVDGLNDAHMSYGLQWADYDNDLDLDLYVVNYDYTNQLFRNDGAGGFVEEWAEAANDGGKGVSVAWQDYNRDGASDLYLANYAGDGCQMIYNDAPRDTFAIATGVIWGPIFDTGNARTLAAGDYDNDGDLDLAVGCDSVRIFRNDSESEYHWVQFDLRDTVSNCFGIGAQISIVADGDRQMREVTTTPGFGNGSPVTAYFGLYQTALLDTVTIVWPDGLTQVVDVPLPVDRKWTITKGELPVSVEDVEPPVLTLSCAPNPAESVASLRFSIGTAGRVSLEVYNLAGRKVRTILAEAAFEAGSHQASWDCRDDAGRTTPSGVYFVRLSVDGSREQRKIVVVR